VKIGYLMQNRPDYLHRLLTEVPHAIVGARPDGTYAPHDLARLVDADALIVSAEPVTDALLAACPRVRIVQRLGVGYENVDLEATRRRGIPTCNLAGVNKEAVAEHGMLLLLALARRFVEAEGLTQAGRWREAQPLGHDAVELKGKTLGIVGLGDTGASLARRARAFEMDIVYNDVRPIDPPLVAALGARFLEKDELYRTADFVSVNVDYNATSANLIDARALGLMRPHARLICCARGGIVDEAALAAALNEGRLAGAGIDVFGEEPVPPGNPLLTARNVVLTSHVAGITEDSVARMFHWAHENVRAVVERGARPRWVVNSVA